MKTNVDKYEKKNIYINYLANYENSFIFIEVFHLCIGRNISHKKSLPIIYRRKKLTQERTSIN